MILLLITLRYVTQLDFRFLHHYFFALSKKIPKPSLEAFILKCLSGVIWRCQNANLAKDKLFCLTMFESHSKSLNLFLQQTERSESCLFQEFSF